MYLRWEGDDLVYVDNSEEALVNDENISAFKKQVTKLVNFISDKCCEESFAWKCDVKCLFHTVYVYVLKGELSHHSGGKSLEIITVATADVQLEKVCPIGLVKQSVSRRICAIIPTKRVNTTGALRFAAHFTKTNF